MLLQLVQKQPDLLRIRYGFDELQIRCIRYMQLKKGVSLNGLRLYAVCQRKVTFDQNCYSNVSDLDQRTKISSGCCSKISGVISS